MSGYLAPQESTHADYEAIELAVMETDRGRNFLQEYARRNRHADTQVLLSALSRIEKSIAIQREPTEIDKFRLDVLEMSRAISRTRAEISSIKPENVTGGGRIVEASGELDSIVAATETATSDILASAEKVQEAAWTMREAGGDAGFCDMLDERATEIYTSCSFQDLTAQRIRKVIDALGFLEKRVNAMIDIWEFTEDPEDNKNEPVDTNAGLVRDPSMSQADVDFVLVEEASTRQDAGASSNRASPAQDVASFDMPAVSMAAQAVEAPPADTYAYVSDVSFVEEATPEAMDVVHIEQHSALNELDMSAATQPALVLPSSDLLAVAAAEDLQAVVPLHGTMDEIAVRNGLSIRDEIDDILFSEPASAQPATDHLKLVSTSPDSFDVIAKARSGEGLTAEEAAQAMDTLKKMSVEDRTRLFS